MPLLLLLLFGSTSALSEHCSRDDDLRQIIGCLEPFLTKWESAEEGLPIDTRDIIPVLHYSRPELLELCSTYESVTRSCFTIQLQEFCANNSLVNSVQKLGDYVCEIKNVDVQARFECISSALERKPECRSLLTSDPAGDKCNRMEDFFKCLQGTIYEGCGVWGVAVLVQAVDSLGCRVPIFRLNGTGQMEVVDTPRPIRKIRADEREEVLKKVQSLGEARSITKLEPIESPAIPSQLRGNVTGLLPYELDLEIPMKEDYTQGTTESGTEAVTNSSTESSNIPATEPITTTTIIGTTTTPSTTKEPTTTKKIPTIISTPRDLPSLPLFMTAFKRFKPLNVSPVTIPPIIFGSTKKIAVTKEPSTTTKEPSTTTTEPTTTTTLPTTTTTTTESTTATEAATTTTTTEPSTTTEPTTTTPTTTMPTTEEPIPILVETTTQKKEVVMNISEACDRESDDIALAPCLKPWFDTWQLLKSESNDPGELFFPVLFYSPDQVLRMCDAYATLLDTCLDQHILDRCRSNPLMSFILSHTGYICSVRDATVLAHFSCMASAVQSEPQCQSIVHTLTVQQIHESRCGVMPEFYQCMEESINHKCGTRGLSMLTQAIKGFGCDIGKLKAPLLDARWGVEKEEEAVTSEPEVVLLEGQVEDVKPDNLPEQKEEKEVKEEEDKAPYSEVKPIVDYWLGPDVTTTASPALAVHEIPREEASIPKEIEPEHIWTFTTTDSYEEIESEAEAEPEPQPLPLDQPVLRSSPKSVEVAKSSPVTKVDIPIPSPSERKDWIEEIGGDEVIAKTLIDEPLLEDGASEILHDTAPIRPPVRQPKPSKIGFRVPSTHLPKQRNSKPRHVSKDRPVSGKRPYAALTILQDERPLDGNDRRRRPSHRSPPPIPKRRATTPKPKRNAKCEDTDRELITECFIPMNQKWNKMIGDEPGIHSVVFPLFRYQKWDIFELCNMRLVALKDCLPSRVLRRCVKDPIIEIVESLLGYACGAQKKPFFMAHDCVHNLPNAALQCYKHIMVTPKPGLSIAQKCRGIPDFYACMRPTIRGHCAEHASALMHLRSAMRHFGCVPEKASAEPGFLPQAKETKSKSRSGEKHSRRPVRKESRAPPTTRFSVSERNTLLRKEHARSSKAISQRRANARHSSKSEKREPVLPLVPDDGHMANIAREAHSNSSVVPTLTYHCTPQVQNYVTSCMLPLVGTWTQFRGRRNILATTTFPLYYYLKDEIIEMCEAYANAFLRCDFPIFHACLQFEVVRFSLNHLGQICKPENLSPFLEHFDCVADVMEEMKETQCLEHIKSDHLKLLQSFNRCDGIPEFYRCSHGRVREKCGTDALASFHAAIRELGCSLRAGTLLT